MYIPKEIQAIRTQAEQVRTFAAGEEFERATMTVYLQVWVIYLGHPIDPRLPEHLQQRIRCSYEQLLHVGHYMDALGPLQLRDQLLEAVTPLLLR